MVDVFVLDIVTTDPNVCFVCVILFYLILSRYQ